jgi:hypothetical protein
MLLHLGRRDGAPGPFRWNAILLAALFVSSCAADHTNGYRKSVPAKLLIEELIASYTDPVEFLESCGMAVFRLNQETADRIESEGLGFFADARTLDLEDRVVEYAPWRSTPANFDDLEGGGGMLCVRDSPDFPPELVKQIGHAYHEPGAFFTNMHEASLLVLPKQRMVVFMHFG